MNEVSQQADLKLQLALKQSHEIIEETMLRAKEKVEDVTSTGFMNELVAIIKDAQLENSRPLGRDEHGFSLRASVLTPKTSAKSFKERLGLGLGLEAPPRTRTEEEMDELNQSVDSLVTESGEKGSSQDHLQDDGQSIATTTGGESDGREDRGKRAEVENDEFVGMRSILRQSIQPQPLNPLTPTVDPSEALHLLPVYMRGGVAIVGFGELLGNALALLYVCRQGLREKELWRMLSRLQFKAEQAKRTDL